MLKSGLTARWRANWVTRSLFGIFMSSRARHIFSYDLCAPSAPFMRSNLSFLFPEWPLWYRRRTGAITYYTSGKLRLASRPLRHHCLRVLRKQADSPTVCIPRTFNPVSRCAHGGYLSHKSVHSFTLTSVTLLASNLCHPKQRVCRRARWHEPTCRARTCGL
jgi:hypothetical protein